MPSDEARHLLDSSSLGAGDCALWELGGGSRLPGKVPSAVPFVRMVAALGLCDLRRPTELLSLEAAGPTALPLDCLDYTSS